MTFQHIKEGDTVTRLLAEAVPMKLKVTSVTEERIWCGPEEEGHDQGWSFDRVTGVEIDDDLGWGPAYGITGSRLIEESQ